MFEGIAQIAGRVAELKTALDSYGKPSASASASGSATSLSGAQSFSQTLKQAQGPTHQFSVGINGASQMPETAGGGNPSLAALGAGGLAGLGLGGGGLGLLSGMGDSLGGSSMGDMLGSGSSDSTGLADLLGGAGSGGSGGLAGLLGGGSGASNGLAGLLGGAGNGTSGLAGMLGSGASNAAGGLAGMLGSGASGAAGGLAGLLGGGSAPSNGLAGLLGGANGAGNAGSGAAGLLGGSGNGLPGTAAPGTSNSAGLQGLVGQVARSQGVNPALAQAVAKAESGYNPQAVSPAGAQGLMQLMPDTFKAYAKSGDAPSGLPVQGSVSQPFGPTDFGNEPPLDWNGQHYAHFHTGVDLAAQQGAPIRATTGGTIEVRSDPGGFGNLIVVRHGPWDVLYGHTSGHPANIQTGSAVKPGDVIGFVGSTGNSTGPHVHYEVRYQGRIIDPSPFLNGGSQAGPMDPVANAKAGVGYLKDMLTRFKNNVPNALAAYNAGPGAVEKYGGVPPYPETQAYVQRTMQYARDLGA